MTKLLLDYNPLTGESCFFQHDKHTNQITVTHTQDVEPALKKAAHLRSDPNHTKHQMKEDLVHYAIVPQVIQLEMKQKHGVDFWDKNDFPKVYKLLNTEYKRFKTTEINHSIRHA